MLVELSDEVLDAIDDAIEREMSGHRTDPRQKWPTCLCGVKDNMDADVLETHQWSVVMTAVRETLESFAEVPVAQGDSAIASMMNEVQTWQQSELMVRIAQGRYGPLVSIWHDGIAKPVDTKSISIAGTRREITGSLVKQGYKPVTSWLGAEDGAIQRAFIQVRQYD